MDTVPGLWKRPQGNPREPANTRLSEIKRGNRENLPPAYGGGVSRRKQLLSSKGVRVFAYVPLTRLSPRKFSPGFEATSANEFVQYRFNHSANYRTSALQCSYLNHIAHMPAEGVWSVAIRLYKSGYPQQIESTYKISRGNKFWRSSLPASWPDHSKSYSLSTPSLASRSCR